MREVRAKKGLGQHFLTNQDISYNIVDALRHQGKVLEVGPGMGVLTQFLIQRKELDLKVAEIDSESVVYLKEKYPVELKDRIIEGDFLQLDLSGEYPEGVAVIGNFPYNISTQIFFHILEHKNKVPEIVGMLQKEVAVRLAAPPTGKEYGILSVLLQAYYDIEYLFDVTPDNFNPPPKVQSGVIRLKRNKVESLDCDEVLMKKIIKATFNQRRKTIRNSLSAIVPQIKTTDNRFLTLRPERLSVADFVELTNEVTKLLEN
ncbi:MAG: 16S rRNA (adenine(1518)-N(6)/adenine(1519)-N(6))-dimethyltransferase RsmA [Rikenellaceae bacterium]